MWIDPRGDLNNFVKVSTTLQVQSLIIAEWNMNDFEKVLDYGSYRYRPYDSRSTYFRLPLNYDILDQGDFYTDANKSIFTFSDFVEDDDEPVLFESDDVNRSLYFDLEQCFEPFRPRSGINKALFFENKYIDDVRSAKRPRYYMASRYDTFKYWNSYRNQIAGVGSGTAAVRAITYGNGLWVAGGYLGQMRTSTNGINWTTVNSNFDNGRIFRIAYGNGTWVAAGETGQMRRSTNGSSWSDVDAGFGNTGIFGLGYGNGRWVATGPVKMRTSTDAIVWSTVTSPFGVINIFSVAYGNGRWVAGGGGGAIGTSTNGTAWTTVNSNFGNTIVRKVSYGNGLWVAGGYSGQMRRSTNGITWTTVNSNFGNTVIDDIAYGDGVWIATGFSGQIRRSTDAINWTTANSNMGLAIRTVEYNDNLWVVGGLGGNMRASSDQGQTWNRVTSNFSNLGQVVEEIGVSVLRTPPGFTEEIGFFIDDTAPFVVYENPFAANRIVVKMQTNLADVESERNLRTNNDNVIIDPLQDRLNSSIPNRWKIEYLDESDNWVTAITFNENSTRRDGSPIVGPDGYVEVYYGVLFPEEFNDSFHLVAYIDDEIKLPDNPVNGEAYILGGNKENAGDLYVWSSLIQDWVSQPAEYGFSFYEEDDTKKAGIVESLVDPKYFRLSNNIVYRELIFLKGVRVAVETMVAPDRTFDLIEISPRLRADISKYVESYSFNKSISNDQGGLPVGGLLASNGDVAILNDEGVFTENNILRFLDGVDSFNTPRIGSLVSKYLKPNIKFVFYETILNVNGYDKYIPIKTMYAEEFTGTSGGTSELTIPLRDLFFRIESLSAPSMFFTNISLTSAVALLLDSIGMSNYVFKGFDEIQESDNFRTSVKDPIIPFFFVNPDASVAQVLLDLAISCQAAMFFDEYNRLVVMPKEYVLPSEGERQTDLVLYGQTEKNGSQTTALPNIVEISNAETRVINDGVIQYNIRYIQREVTTIPQIDYLDEDKVYGYKPVLLWEVGEAEELKTINETTKSQSGYALGAAPLNKSIGQDPPTVVNNTIINNIIDLGDNVYWLPRFQGYLFANGEIIRYDAVEYNVSGTGIVWITSNQQYQKYFSSLPFNGKIYPTGNIRIFAEPFYVEYEGAQQTENLPTGVRFKDGPVERHGRGQFGTEITPHEAGLSPYWSNNENVRGCRMTSSFIFSTTPTEKITYPAFSTNGPAIGVNNNLAQKSTRNGIIKNFLRQSYPTDDIVKTLKSTQSGTIQSSALVFAGPQEFPSNVAKRDFISYIYRELDSPYKHVGTRLRIVGGLKNNDKIQSPINAATYFNVQASNTRDSINLDGGSGGIGIGVNPSTNYGYFFEICALTADNLEQYRTVNKDTGAIDTVLHNLIFYKTVRNNATGEAVPYKLWGGTAKIIVDEGLFIGMDRIGIEENPTVYDIAVEYENRGSVRRFYLYVNGTQIAIVDDASPLPEYRNLALFVRGGTECMFEHVYALQNLMSRNTGTTVFDQISDSFSIDKATSSQALRKYSLSGFIKSSYLSAVSPQHYPNFKIYFEEFGTIMRECAYFNIRYDQAYPALIAQIAPTFGQERGYTVSGFYGGSYGAEFLVFNNNDRFVELDETTGNYLRIIGVTFTQNVNRELTVDDFLKQRSRLSDPFIVNGTIQSPVVTQKFFDDVKTSRKKHGKKEFSLSPVYIQSEDDANEMMDWLINKTLKNRLSLDINVFGVPQLQLGDIISIDFDLPEGVKFVNPNKQFVVQSIQQSRSPGDLTTNIKVVEV